MKKFFSLLLVLALLVIIPVGAEVKYSANEAANKAASTSADDADGNKIRSYTFYIDVTGDEPIPASTPITVKYDYKSAIKSIECTAVDGFTVASEGVGAGTITCVYTPKEAVAPGTKIAVGGWKATQLKDAKQEDCAVNYTFQNSTKTVNPQTGSSISYIIVGCGIAAAVVAFAVSRKKSKLYNL